MSYRMTILSFLGISLLLPISAGGIITFDIHDFQLINPSISSPLPGQILHGNVVIQGKIPLLGFQSYEVDIARTDDLVPSWSLVYKSTVSVQEGVLAIWDTTLLADGMYDLRLVVYLENNLQMNVEVASVHVQNHIPTYTITPGRALLIPSTPTTIPLISQVIPSASLNINNSHLSTPTSLPPNPAEISSSRIAGSLQVGATFTISCFILLGVYLGILHLRDNHK